LQQRTTSNQDTQAITVHVAGHPTALRYTVSGPEEASSVLVLHGWGSNAGVMRGVVQFLSRTHRVYNIDLPGHGNSPPPPVPWTLEDHSSAVRDFVAQCVHNDFVIFGHSNGGRIALFLASDESPPQQLKKLILVSPSGMRRTRSLAFYVRKTIATILKAPFQILPGKAKDYGMDWLRHTIVWSLLGSSEYRVLQGVMRETFVKTVNAYVEDRLASVHIPVLIFWGDEDEAISRQQMEVLESGIDDAGLVVIEGAGHYAFLDRPDIVEAASIHFISSR
jgi:pimeloyl-ACP methyl ester carboxylesterase